MAVHVSSFSAPTSTGNHSITGLPFQPVAVMFWGLETDLGNPSNFYGCSSGSGENWAMWTGMDDQASAYDRRYQELRNDHCIWIKISPGFTTVDCSASMVSLDATGFTLNFDNPGNPNPIYYMAIGGDNISNAHAGTFTRTAATGTLAITGTGFQPNAVIVGHVAGSSFNTMGGGMSWGLGFSDGTNTYSSYGFGYQGAGNQVRGSHLYRTDKIACAYIDAITATYHLGLTSMDSNGFTTNVSTAWVASIAHGYLAIESAAATVGNGTQPTSTGTATFSTPGFEPGGVLFSWNGADAGSTTGGTATPVRPGVGGMTDTAQHAVSFIHRSVAPFGAYVPDAYADGDSTDTLAINIRGEGAQTAPLPHKPLGFAVFDSFAQDEFTIEWTAAEGGTRSFGWLALPGDLPVFWIPHIYRQLVTA